MLLRVGVLGCLLAAVAAWPALAESCGSAPIAPAIPTPGVMKQKSPADAVAAKHDAFVDIRNWQSDLKNYRNCLNSMGAQDKQQLQGLDPQKDGDKIKRLKDDAEAAGHQYDNTVDAEERVVNEFHAIQVAYCTRTDVDKSSCPKQ